MYKIIDLDIDGTITGDTRIQEIAMVELPAIEQNFIYFAQEQSFIVPQGVASKACKARKFKDENGTSCGTNVGWTRSAQLCSREPISLDTVKRMYSYFSRHQVDLQSSKSYEDGCGLLMWDAWGGDPGKDWSERIVKRYEKMAEVDDKGRIKESPKAPKSDTPNKDPKGEGSARGKATDTRSADVSARVEDILKEKSDDFNEKYKDKLGYGVNVGMLKTVYQRGAGAYNTSHSPAVKSAEQWALARVNAFLYLVKNGRPENPKYTTDYDLLPEKHPKKGNKEEDMDYDTGALPGYVNYPSGNTNNEMLIEPIDFIEKVPYEKKDDYISRCVEYHIKNKGMDSDQAYAVCINQADEAFSIGQKVSFDYDDTLNTPKGRGLALGEIKSGSEVYIISARGSKQSMLPLADELGIPHDRVFATGSNRLKIQKVKSLRIDRHYDNNEDVVKELGRVGMDFSCPCSSGTFHVHKDENGNEVYISCELSTDRIETEFCVDDYTPEEIEAVKLLYFLKENNHEEFEAVIGTLRGATEDEVKKRNHKTATTYFKYERVIMEGSPDRDFCVSIEGRYFRRLEIDLLRDLNTEYGHQKQPYSKWLFKGGPQCVHAWRRYFVQGDVISDQGMVEGTPGQPPKLLPNNGYYNEDTKRKSEVAYIISQQEMNKQFFGSEPDKRMIYSPLMIPNILIPRIDEDTNEKYFVRFTPQSIEKMAQLYMIEKRLDQTNYEHTNQKMNSVILVESWIVSGESDKSYQLGFERDDIPNGTWMGGFKVMDTPEGDIIWNDFVKTGRVKGFSVEGEFLMKFSRQEKDEYLLQEIINIIQEIND